MSSIEKDILEWSKRRPAWERNLLKRIARGETIDGAYISSVAKAIIDENVQLETPELLASDLPAGATEAASVQLLSIGQLKFVNALLDDQSLTFGATGVTVIYGDNGSGKSGYARLVKDVVGARHHEEILPNAFRSSTGAQSAQVSYALGGIEATETWPGIRDSALNQAHFYDEACGNDYLNRDTELTYRPSVLSLLDVLIVHVDAVRASIDAMIKDNEAEEYVRPSVQSGTPAEDFLGRVSSSTTKKEIDEALALPPQVKVVYAELVKEQARLQTTNPAKEKQRLLTAAGQVAGLADHFELLDGKLSPERADKLLAMRTEAAALRAATTEASKVSFAEEPLSGVGTDTWRVLWQAAENYSVEEAYQDSEFPATEDGNVCVLCQQLLQPDAKERLRRFHHFVHDDVAKRATAAEALLKQAVDDLATFEVFSQEATMAISILEPGERPFAEFLTAALETAKQAKDRIDERLGGESKAPWISLATLDLDKLRGCAVALKSQADAIDEVAFEKSLADCQRDLAALEGKMTIAKARPEIEKEVIRLLAHDTLKRVLATITTRSISVQSAKLARTYVTDRVKERFVSESKWLKLEHVVLGDKGTHKGRLRHKPTLLGSPNGSPKAVLSEGEQTAAGLAGFFTEVHFDTTKSAVILDDPMSSLDHARRERVARRVVEIATDRQVVVFTHDLMFLGEIVKASDELDVLLTERAIERNGARRPGLVIDGHPWKAKDAKKRIDNLVGELAGIRKNQADMTGDEYERAAAEWAGKLSETWERIVRSEIAFKLVDRGTTNVHPKMFRIAAKITDDDNTDFQSGYGATSRWARRHDKSEEINYVPPEVDEMKFELDRISRWFSRVKGYSSGS
ncbi:AAA family ATPase [Corynebacterium variabile]|uniref:AAA family ATPase n=1 Tax=Corynebacterium variabile TaxID=1727 RepID=UPI003FCEFCFE